MYVLCSSSTHKNAAYLQLLLREPDLEDSSQFSQVSVCTTPCSLSYLVVVSVFTRTFVRMSVLYFPIAFD